MDKRSLSSSLHPGLFVAGFGLVFCVLWLVVAILGVVLPILKVGLPLAIAAGGWHHLQKRRQRQQALLDHAFYKLLKEHDGYITTLEFAMTAKLSGAVARQYLDNRAKEFSAQFGISEVGEVFYIFPVVRSHPPTPFN